MSFEMVHNTIELQPVQPVKNAQQLEQEKADRLQMVINRNSQPLFVENNSKHLTLPQMTFENVENAACGCNVENTKGKERHLSLPASPF